ncbi:MAG: hypothetical protein JWN62_679 [Acidimicrobiales bacterium]|nr:hypothetical protein [Acidimicrobiales bacterium]
MPPQTASANTVQVGNSEHPDGTWTFIRRLEEANPPYTDFLAGQPDAQQWVFNPQCDGNQCDLKVYPGDNGYLPAGWPAKADDGARVFTLQLQHDGSYKGTDTVDGLTSCNGSDGTAVEHAAQRSYDYHLIYFAADGAEASHIEGKLTVNEVPNAAGTAAGCIEFHDVQGLFAQPLNQWADVDPATLTFGRYDWGGRVVDADQYYLDHTARVGEFVHFNSFIDMDAACTGDPCSVGATGAAPAYGKEASTFTWKDGEFATTVTYQDTCVANDGGALLTEHGYDVVAKTVVRPVIIVHGEVLAWVGTFSSVSTPTPQAAASWPSDCIAGHESEAIAASTTQPYFNGL